ncbi:MAG TPA: zinc ribbon domain-containing protein [Syntrophorhabdaceae bacterium]|nr:zinc ribbon domain-containing protein [Syntrophorhabdaceae bacterium]
MESKEYECGDCGRAFRLRDDERSICPSCESGNVELKKAKPLPSWVLLKARETSG